MRTIFLSLFFSLLFVLFLTTADRGVSSSFQKDPLIAQRQLKNLGYNPGIVDGMLGKKTTKAIKQFQGNNKLLITGELDEGTKAKLRLLEKKTVCGHTTIADDISVSLGRSLDSGRALVVDHFGITMEP